MALGDGRNQVCNKCNGYNYTPGEYITAKVMNPSYAWDKQSIPARYPRSLRVGTLIFDQGDVLLLRDFEFHPMDLQDDSSNAVRMEIIHLRDFAVSMRPVGVVVTSWEDFDFKDEKHLAAIQHINPATWKKYRHLVPRSVRGKVEVVLRVINA